MDVRPARETEVPAAVVRAETLAAHPADWRFQAAYPSAADLLPEALERLRDGRTEEVADFEPFYLKDFIPGTPKDPLGLRTPSA